jgi:dTDP-glucose 4,6-dehydratase
VSSEFTPRHILVTGGAGFIGSAYVRHVLATDHDVRVTVLDKLTYAGNPANLASVAEDARYHFIRGDIANRADVDAALQGSDALVNFAAETHVDRSILDAGAFVTTDVYGSYVLLEAVRAHGTERALFVSTDEVYGHVEEGESREDGAFLPRSPYAASKAGGEMLVRAYHITYGTPALVTRGSNTFGPYHYPEKLIPLMITNAIDDIALPVYGDGRQRRDWLYVDDHAAGIHTVLRRGTPGEAYNLGGGNERENIEVVRLILELLKKPDSLIRHVPDRPGHDRRYALDSTKARALGWQPSRSFEQALSATVDWYRDNEDWWRPLKSGEFQRYYREQYEQRLQAQQGERTA